MKNWFPWVALLLVWGVIIVVVDPRGEFMVNDDWAFVRSLEAFRSTGSIMVTGWGPPGAPGGPALLVHLLLGDLFSRIFGFSLTTLRVAVLTMGILGSFGLLLPLAARQGAALARSAGDPDGGRQSPLPGGMLHLYDRYHLCLSGNLRGALSLSGGEEIQPRLDYLPGWSWSWRQF